MMDRLDQYCARYRDMSGNEYSYFLCLGCGIVDRDEDRSVPGHACPVCGVATCGNRMFFRLGATIIIQLIETSYFRWPEQSSHDEVSRRRREELRNSATLIFFCTLKELLLETFTEDIMEALHLNQEERTCLREEYSTHSKRLHGLLPTLIKTSWQDALSSLPIERREQYCTLDRFLKDATKRRNDLLHDANWLASDDEIATSCVRAIPQILELYVDLHNQFVHPLMKDERNTSRAGLTSGCT